MKKRSLIPETRVKNPEPKKKDDNCMITSIGQKINISSDGWDPFNK